MKWFILILLIYVYAWSTEELNTVKDVNEATQESSDASRCESCVQKVKERETHIAEKARLEKIFDRNRRYSGLSNVGGASARIKLRSNLEIVGSMIQDEQLIIQKLDTEIKDQCDSCGSSTKGS